MNSTDRLITELHTQLIEKERTINDLRDTLQDREEYIYILEEAQQRIDKAIEYIKTQVHRNQQFYEMDKDNLLEILGDKENDNNVD